MPSRHIVKQFASDSYYHVYNRGVSGQKIFLDSIDKKYFLNILARHLDPNSTITKSGGLPYQKFNDELELLCYCLMGNHFHLLLFQKDNPTALTAFMRPVLTAYTMYFNRKYKRTGPLFQSIYKSSSISDDSYLLHITRYIHLNPRNYRTYHYSSLSAYLGQPHEPWLQPARILALFEGDNYMVFLEDYIDHKAMFESLKTELANPTSH